MLAPGLDLRAVHHGPDAGYHSAANEAADHEVGVVGHFNAGVGERNRLLGEGGPHVIRRLSIKRHACDGHTRVRLAQGRTPKRAVAAVSAHRVEREDYLVARSDARYTGADLTDDARALVAQHPGQSPRLHVAVDEMVVAVANARADHVKQHLSLARLLDFEVSDGDPGLWLFENCGSHGSLLRLLGIGVGD